MRKQEIEISRDIIINAIKSMTSEQLELFIDSKNIDFRLWHKVKINGEEVPWWACDYELDNVKERYKDVEFEPIAYCESWSV